VTQLERMRSAEALLFPAVAELIVAGGADDPLEVTGRKVAWSFWIFAGFTAFAETSEPEEVMRVLREYHAEMG